MLRIFLINMKKNKINNQNGMALLAAIIFVVVLTSFGIALLGLSNSDTKLSTLHRGSNQAFYLAETGIEKAFYNLNISDDYDMLLWRPDSNSPYSEGTTEEYFEVTIQNIGLSESPPLDKDTDKIEIQSTGFVSKETYNSAQRKILVKAKIDFLITAAYKYAILSDRVIIFQGTPGPEVTGDVHSNDDLEVMGHFADNYDYHATCSGDNNEVDGTSTGYPEQPIPPVDYEALRDYALNTDGFIHGDVTLDNGDVENWTGVHYIEGDLIAKNGSTINVTNGAIIVEGNVDIRAKASFTHTKDESNDPNNWADSGFAHLGVIAQGDILLHAKSAIVNGAVQSVLQDPPGTSTGTIDLRNEASIYGSVIAQTVHLHNKCHVIYDGDTFSGITTQGDGFYKKVSWQEI